MHITRSIAIAAMMTALAAGSAAAQGNSANKGKGQEQSPKAQPAARSPAKGNPAVRQAPRQDDTRRAQPAARTTPRPQGAALGHAAAPPKGGTPPGQAKKRYRTDDGLWVLRDVLLDRGYTITRLARANDHRYVYYRLPDGTIRRAAVQPGDDRLHFVNVPDLVLRQVLARLY